MAEIVSLKNQDLNRFISGEKGKILTYLRKNYSVSDDDIDDIFQESSMALYLNIRDGKLSNLTSSLGTYFMKVCINQTLKFLGKSSKVVPLVDESRISNGNIVRDDKIDELYGFCMDTEEEDRKIRMELLVNNIIASMTDTCKNILQGYYWNDLSTSTIADMFGFSDANSVKAQKYKCVKKFRDKYNELKGKIYG
ncbi:sigma-70 family RNA polymerase sigma factor [Prevotella sp. P6B1]|uniref:sigma-70 family RNA polymerase sigma factor n=1 Tax=Prevotella sp. P6B1 TaxID=1410613 RepID=UPI00051AF37E|nr:sigma-70 family RNA polymerase sigma factor [Prevotella sp. P6B1]